MIGAMSFAKVGSAARATAGAATTAVRTAAATNRCGMNSSFRKSD
jgi:hypothetical protein